MLQGTPKKDLVWDKRVEIIYAYQDKPYIFLLAKVEKERVPQYFVMPWTEENMYKIRKIQETIQMMGSAQGQFKKPRGYTGAESDFFFTEVERFEDKIRKGGFATPGIGP